MPSYRLDVILILLTAIWIISGCVLNDCICANDGLFCESTDTSTPSLTDNELDLIEYMEITVTQVQWIKEVITVYKAKMQLAYSIVAKDISRLYI